MEYQVDTGDQTKDAASSLCLIRPSRSPWVSLIVILPKRNGSLSFCIYYRRVYSVKRKESFPLPNIITHFWCLVREVLYYSRVYIRILADRDGEWFSGKDSFCYCLVCTSSPLCHSGNRIRLQFFSDSCHDFLSDWSTILFLSRSMTTYSFLHPSNSIYFFFRWFSQGSGTPVLR